MTLNNTSLILIACFLCVSHSLKLTGQKTHANHQECISDEEYTALFSLCDANAKKFGLDKQKKSAIPALNWPLRLAPGYDYPGYYTIFNFVDLDPSTDAVLDYNCGSRTYDGHRGIDIDLDPFEWQMMNEGAVEVIAAAAGTITIKDDGNFDQNCSCTGAANRVVIDHADGSRTLYYHLKANSLTSKDVGDFINTGEYIGLVGSSGCSTWPHLHFEVRNANNQVVEPFAGSCNSITSPWITQRPYHDSGINRIGTYAEQPIHSIPNCSGNHEVNQKDHFYKSSADNIVIQLDLRHTLSGQFASVSVKDPLGNLVMWNETIALFNTKKFSTVRFFTLNIFSSLISGKYTATVSYLGQTASHDFWITESCADNRVLTNQVHSYDRWYNASQTITSNSSSLSGVETLYNAGDRIVLTPGFDAGRGFHAYLENACPN